MKKVLQSVFLYAIMCKNRNGRMMMPRRSFIKKSGCASLVVVTALIPCVFAGCSDKTPEKTDVAAGDDLMLLPGIELDYENMFFDDFTDGVDPDNWMIGKQAWGANGNGGVVPENVNYTDDGILVLTGNGEYYTSGAVKGVGSRRDGTLSGAALISRNVYGAGRYEVKMKVLPRLGTCNAFWTFSYDNDTAANHEIDIELPGGTHSTGIISYERMLNTNYHTESANQSQDTAISDNTNGVITNFADGEWHTFGFDWYTLESDEDKDAQFGRYSAEEITEELAAQGVKAGDVKDTTCGRVVYFVDGKVTAVSNVFVPFLQTRMWLGIWFPNNAGFVGDANFESDNMYVDWVRHIPFKDQPIEEFTPKMTGDVATLGEYPSAPITIAPINGVANGDFEYIRREGATNSGWQYYKRNMTSDELAAIRAAVDAENPLATYDEKTEIYNAKRKEITSAAASAYCTVAEGIGDKGSCGLKVEKIGLVGQVIDSIFEGFELKLDFAASGKGCVNVLFMGNGDDIIEQNRIAVDAGAWKSFAKELVAPVGTKRVEIEITSEFDTPLFIDGISMFKVKQ